MWLLPVVITLVKDAGPCYSLGTGHCMMEHFIAIKNNSELFGNPMVS